MRQDATLDRGPAHIHGGGLEPIANEPVTPGAGVHTRADDPPSVVCVMIRLLHRPESVSAAWLMLRGPRPKG
jgi:hypothetical protein